MQPDPGGLGGEPGQQGRADRLHEAVAGSQAEGAHQPGRVYLLLGAQHGVRILHQLADLSAQGQGPRRGHQTPTRPHQQRIPRGLPQPGQGPAHGGGAQGESSGGTGHAALVQQGIQGQQQIEVGGIHGIALAEPGIPGDDP
ncbi:hypothetical protein D3C72_1080000 [compost metagenome]